MSHKADRIRAESGIIFRNGKLVNKEEWYKSHPTKQMQRQTVRSAVKDELAKKFVIVKPENLITIPPVVPNRYYCTACRRYHVQTSKIGSEHTNFYLAEKGV
jgi:hypothetical protein